MLIAAHALPGIAGATLSPSTLRLAAILPVVYGLNEPARGGWQPLPVAAIVVGLGVGWRFVRRQHALATVGVDPLLDLRLFANRAFTTTLGSPLANSTLAGGDADRVLAFSDPLRDRDHAADRALLGPGRYKIPREGEAVWTLPPASAAFRGLRRRGSA